MANTENYSRRSSILSRQHSPRPWRVTRHGLNIKGFCTNARCDAHSQRVVINLGIGEFDFARIILERKNKCPECFNRITPTKYTLINCQWRYVQHYSIQEFPLNTVRDNCQWKELPCEYIIIETMPLPVANRLRSLVQECPICLSRINTENKNEISYLCCAHVFHRTCIDQWLGSNEPMASRCPICRVYIAERC